MPDLTSFVIPVMLFIIVGIFVYTYLFGEDE
jgi:hypothetical protein